MKLTVEIQKGGDPEVAVSFDRDGLDLLVKKLEYLRDRIDHLHLMTQAWAGSELTDEGAGGPEYEIINSLRLVRLPD